jgi:hypothetical protein
MALFGASGRVVHVDILPNPGRWIFGRPDRISYALCAVQELGLMALGFGGAASRGRIFALLLNVLTFCSAHAQVTVVDADYYPLEPGARWSYEMRPKNGGDAMTQTIAVEGAEVVGDRTRFVIREMDPISTMRTHIEKDAGAVHLLARERAGGILAPLKTRYVPALTLLKLPLVVGDAWSSESDVRIGLVSSRIRTECTVDQVERVEVPAGTFECVRVTAKRFRDGAPLPDAVAWYAPGIGLVKYVGGKYVRSLVRFDDGNQNGDQNGGIGSGRQRDSQ